MLRKTYEEIISDLRQAADGTQAERAADDAIRVIGMLHAMLYGSPTTLEGQLHNSLALTANYGNVTSAPNVPPTTSDTDDWDLTLPNPRINNYE